MPRSVRTLLLSIALLLAGVPARAQFSAFGPPISRGTGESGNSSQGSTLSIDVAGNTLAMGGPTDAVKIGATWIFTRGADGAWTQMGPKLVGTGDAGGASQGQAIALSGDGQTLVVGGPADNFNRGAFWIFTRNGSSWAQQGPKLFQTPLVGLPHLGSRVAISGDGNLVLVSAPGDVNTPGATYTYVRQGGAWHPSGGNITDSLFTARGGSVALSADGNTALVTGDFGTGSGTGIFIRSGNAWTRQGVVNSGSPVVLSADGNTAMIGQGEAPVLVYSRSQGVWTLAYSLTGTGAVGSARQGEGVACSADGRHLVVGGPGDANNTGAGWLFVTRKGTALQQGPKLVAPAPASLVGKAAAMSADGSTVFLSAPNSQPGAGIVWIFTQTSMTLLSVRDIPADQGGRVRLTWTRSVLDSLPLGTDQVRSYSVWRRIPVERLAARLRANAAALDEDSLGTQYDQVATLPAIQSRVYNVVVPTLADSTAADPARFTFLVTAHTADPDLFYVGAADSGSSVDDLAPPAPATLTATVVAGAVNLSWGASHAPDLAGYRVYRGATPDFVADAQSLLLTTTDNAAVDATPAAGYYKVSAVDVHGNQSPFASTGPVLGVGPVAGGMLELSAVSPNPSRGQALHVSFVLPQAGSVQLEVFDIGGRRRVAWEDPSLAPGPHAHDLAETAALAPGTYVVRLTQAGRSRSARAIVVR